MTPDNEYIELAVMDRSTFAEIGYGETIADIARRTGIGQPQTNIPLLEPSLGGKGTRIARAQLLLQKLDYSRSRPQILFLESCHNAIRTIPTLQHDTHKPEDVDTDGEDHSFDAITYAIQKL